MVVLARPVSRRMNAFDLRMADEFSRLEMHLRFAHLADGESGRNHQNGHLPKPPQHIQLRRARAILLSASDSRNRLTQTRTC
jgi:hypothetical protein